MAPLLGWSEAQAEREVAFYHARVAAERASQEQPDDESADETRLNVEDIVPVRD